jgi:benzoylformate decarboxylase
MLTPAFAGLSQIAPRRGAGLLLEILEAQRVEYIFGNPGTTELPLMDALIEAPAIGYVLALQEASAVAMADGYAQASGRPGFLNLHTAGGLGHGMGALLNARIAQTPLVVTAGQQDSRHAHSDPLLQGDLVSLAAPAVKWAQEVTSPDQLPVLVHRAFNDASAAPRGPVFLSLPMNVMEEMTSASPGEISRIERRAIAAGLEDLAQALASVEPGRLAIIAGDEVHASGAAAQVVQLAETLGAPVFGSSWPSRIPYPTAHPLWAGNLSTKAPDIARVLGEFDAVFALGGKSLITILYAEESALPQGCALFQLSEDVRDLGRTFSTRLSMVGDIQASLRVLEPLLAARTAARRPAYDRLLKAAAARRDMTRAALEATAQAQFEAPTITPMVAAREVVRAIGPNVPIVDEAIATSAHVRRFLRSESSAQYSFLRGGALGWAMPASVGCSLGLGREPVVCLIGDGAALYSPQALWTAAHEKLPITFVVMNNREYNVLKNFMRGQEAYASTRTGRFIAMDIVDPAIDYVALAASMGLPARRIEKAGDVAAAIADAVASGRPNLVEIVIAAE